MDKLQSKNTLAATIGTALAATSMGFVGNAQVTENPFEMKTLSSGYMIAEKAEGQQIPKADVKRKGSVGDDKLGSGQCGEGKCGTDAKSGEGELTGSTGENKLGGGQCGEGKCGTDALKEKN